MSNLYESNEARDNEQRKFQPDSEGNTAVNVVSLQLQEIINLLTAQPEIAWTKLTVNIDASQTLVIDVKLLNSFTRAEYIITGLGLSSNNSKSLQLSVGNDNGNLSDSVSSRLGTDPNFGVNVSKDSTDMFVEVENATLETITLTILKAVL